MRICMLKNGFIPSPFSISHFSVTESPAFTFSLYSDKTGKAGDFDLGLLVNFWPEFGSDSSSYSSASSSSVIYKIN